MSIANVTFLGNEPFAVESPLQLVEGASITFVCTYADGTTVSGTPTAVAYKKKTAVTTTVFPTGSVTASGNVVTLKPATGFIGGNKYIIAVTAVVDSITLVHKFQINAAKDESEQ